MTTTKQYILAADGINYLEVTTNTEDSGAYTATATLVGPADALAADYADKIEAQSNFIAGAGYAVSFAKRDLNDIATLSGELLTLTGTDPLLVVQSRYEAELLTPGWTIDTGTGELPLVFTVNASGTLRYSIDGAAASNAEVFSAGLIRLRKYPDADTNTEFYNDGGTARFFSLPNRNVIINRP